MNRIKLLASLALLLVLAACGSQSETQAPEQTTRLAADEEGGVPIQMRLILGTFLLEGTDLAVSEAQAAELLPLWKAVRSLSASDTAAQAELDAVLNQIQSAMTADQIQAIANTELAPDGMRALFQELGIEFGPPEGSDGGDFQFQGGGNFVPGQGGQFGGQGGPGGPGGGGFPGGGFQGGQGNLDPDQIATLQAERGGQGFGFRTGRFLLDPLIELLEGRAGLDSA